MLLSAMPDPYPLLEGGNNQGQCSALAHEQSLHCTSPLVRRTGVWLCCLCSEMCAAQQPSTDMLAMLCYLIEREQCPEEPALTAEQSLGSHPSSQFSTCFGRQLNQMVSLSNENKGTCTKIPWGEAPIC